MPDEPIMTAEESARSVAEIIRPELNPAAEAQLEAWHAGPDVVDRAERLPERDDWHRIVEMANFLARSPLMPKHIRDSRDPEADAVVVLLAAHDLNLSATDAFQKLFVIDGKLGQSAELMRSLILRRGHDLNVEVTYEDGPKGRFPVKARAYGFRKERPDKLLEAEFTLDDAAVAGLGKWNDDGDWLARDSQNRKKPWEMYTEDLLVARASSRWARRHAPDCLGGISYTADELGEISVVNEADPYEAVSDDRRQAIRELIGGYSDETQAWIKEEWKRLRLRPLVATEHNPQTLGTDELALVTKLLGDAQAREPQDAEVVHEEPAAEPAAQPVEGSEEPAEEDSGLFSPERTARRAELHEWAGALKPVNVRECLLHAGLDIQGNAAAQRVRLAEFQESVEFDDVEDPRRCKECGGYAHFPPPRAELCSCPL